MNYDDARAGQCSSCPIKQDMSNYWTPKLYYMSENGTYIDVPQSGDGQGVFGGMTVYYLQRGGPNNDNLTAYPKDFRMLAGDPFKRAPGSDFASQAVSFVCLDYNGQSSYHSGLPDRVCPNGMRAQVFFPSCWDGKNLDSADHKSHMAYPTKYSYDNGPCPATHPVHMISIFFEVIYSTAGFDWWNGTTQPFVFAQGDPTGYGFHGDFLNGWDVGVLQKATDTCTADSGLVTDCPVFDFFTNAQTQACVIAPTVQEAVTGELDRLPGCNAVSYGPGSAPRSGGDCKDSTKLGAGPVYYQNVTGWDYVGCGPDSVASRTFTNNSLMSDSMTVEMCLTYCKSHGLNYAGLEYATQCYCGDSLPASLKPTPGVLGNCFSPCAGNSSQYCGGASRLSMYYTADVSSIVSCPSGDGKDYTTPNNATFAISCSGDYSGKDLSMVYVSNGIQDCVQTCSTTAGCVAVSLAGTACYMKSTVGDMRASTRGNAAKLVSGGTAASSAASSTRASSSSSAPTTMATNGAGSVYNLYYSSDSNQGAYSNAQASSSFSDCMNFCDADSKCSAFTYVGGKNGVGAGTCWLKSQLGSPSSSDSNHVSGSRVRLGNKAVSSSSSSALTGTSRLVTATGTNTASGSSATASSTAAACPANNNTIYTDKSSGLSFLIECGIDHSGGDLKMVYTSDLAACIQSCAQTTGCVDVSLSGSACYMKKSVGSVVKSNGIKGAKLVSTSGTAAANVNVDKKVASTSSSSKKTSSSVTTLKTAVKEVVKANPTTSSSLKKATSTFSSKKTTSTSSSKKATTTTHK
jgi:hypothetical protein